MRSTIQIHHGHDKNTPIVTGCPFPQSLDLSGGATIRYADGTTGRAQAAALTGPTPGGVRWWELSFCSTGEGQAAVEPAEQASAEAALAAETADGVALDNGPVRAVLAASGGAPLGIRWPGGEGTLVPELRTEELGCCREPDGATREVAVLRNGPVRAQVELKGTLRGTDGAFDYRLTVEIWREQPGLRVDWMLTHAIPGKLDVTVQKATLAGDWQVGDSPVRVFCQSAHGEAWKPRDVVNPDPVTLIADETRRGVHVADPAMLLDDTVYPHYCAPPVTGTGAWLELRGRRGRMSAQGVDFTETRPNALASEGSTLSYLMVPPGKPIVWSQGWRKEQTLLLSFTADKADAVPPRNLAGKAAALFALGRAQPSPATLRRLACFDLDRVLTHVPGRHLRFSALLDQLCCLVSRGSKMDLGDTPDWHYTRGYATGGNLYFPQPPFESFPRHLSHGGSVFPDVLKYFLEPVWTNNEYDVIHTIATEVMRTGRNDHFRMLRWTARHNVEIDFLSYADDTWHHRASPFHSHFHNRKGAITSHFWTQGLLQYYCLTGDRDALEVARALGDKIIEVNRSEVIREWKFDREIGWALLALCCLAEAGEVRYLDEARTIAAFLHDYNRDAFDDSVKLTGGKAGRSLARQMIDCAFGYASMVEALDRYQNLAGDEASHQWLRQLLHDLKDGFWEKIGEGEPVAVRSMVGLVMAIGFERTGDKDFLAAGRLIIERWLDTAVNSPFDICASAGTEAGQTKPCAMAYRGLHRLLGALDRENQLARYEYAALREHQESAD